MQTAARSDSVCGIAAKVHERDPSLLTVLSTVPCAREGERVVWWGGMPAIGPSVCSMRWERASS